MKAALVDKHGPASRGTVSTAVTSTDTTTATAAAPEGDAEGAHTTADGGAIMSLATPPANSGAALRLRVLRSDSHFEYQHSDRNSGRVRMHRALFATLGVRIGWILRLRVHLDDSERAEVASYDVLCSAWPDNDNRLGENDLCLSDTVVVAVNEALPTGPLLACLQAAARQRWRQSTLCSVVGSHPPSMSSSVVVTLTDATAGDKASLLYSIRGLPVTAGAAYMVHGARVGTISSALPGGAALVVPSTIVTFKQQAVDTSGAASENCSIDSSATFVVEELTRRIIDPLLAAPEGGRNCLYRGVLLLGPPGVGKTHAVRAVRQRCRHLCDVHIAELKLASLLAATHPRRALDAALTQAQQRPQGAVAAKAPSQATYFYTPPSQKKDKSTPSSSDKSSASTSKVANRPCVTFVMVDEIDALGSGDGCTEAQRSLKRRLCQWMDSDLPAASHYLCVVATSNRPEDVDLCFRRGGRIEHEIHVLPTKKDRRRALQGFLAAYRSSAASRAGPLAGLCSEELDALCDSIANSTGGYVTADLRALCDQAFAAAAQEASEEVAAPALQALRMLQRAMCSVAPSCLRGAVTKVDTRLTLDDVIGLAEAKKALCNIVGFSAPERQLAVRRFGLGPPGGALLHGPPGNSKTRLVAAVASHFRLPVISLSAADVYSAYVGDAEAEIRKAFCVARQASPCVLFIDEIDAIVTNRQLGGGEGSGGAEARVLATFLVEMDGVSSAGGSSCIVIAATNRLRAIDKALLRKGRFHYLLHVPSPGPDDRLKLLQYFVGKYSGSGGGLDVDALRSRLREGMSGAEVEGMVKEEALALLRKLVAEREGQGTG